MKKEQKMKTKTKNAAKNSRVKSGADVRKKVDEFLSDGKNKLEAKAAAAKKNFQAGAEEFKEKVGDNLNRLGKDISVAGKRLSDGK